MKTLRSLLIAAASVALVLVSPSFAQTIYNQPANPVAQIVGGPGASVAKPTFSATIALPVGDNAVIQLDGVNTTSATSTLTSGAAPFGKLLVVITKADASGTVTYTFGTGFKSTGTSAPTAGKTLAVAFVGDGTNFVEFARSVSAITY